MTRFHESALVDSVEGIQFKVYSSTHPKGFIIAKPKYIPSSLINFTGLKRGFYSVSACSDLTYSIIGI